MREVALQRVPLSPSLDEYPFRLRARMLLEEVHEFVEACGFESDPSGVEWNVRGEHDWAEMIDALIDTIVVAVGGLRAMGVEMRPFWEAVHASNMAKKGGPINAEGKRLKPEGWRAPPIAEILGRMRAQAIDRQGRGAV